MAERTSGELLKDQLGLTDFKHVRICRALISSYKILLVYYDSYHVNYPISTFRIRQWPFTTALWSGSRIAKKRAKPVNTTPPMDIEDYQGQLNGAIIITVDLAGNRFTKPSSFTKVFESKESEAAEPIYTIMGTVSNLHEFLTFADLNNKMAISNFTMKFRKERTKLMGAENTQAKLIDCFVSEADNSVTFAFLTTATPYPDDPDHEYFEADPKKHWELQMNKGKVYELQFKIIDFFSWLKTHPGVDKITMNDIKEILKVSNIKISSTSPSFHWQGGNFYLSQLDGSIYPTDIEPTENIYGDNGKLVHKGWKSYTGEDHFTDKHIYGLLRQIKFFLNPMASMLTGKLQKRGVI